MVLRYDTNVKEISTLAVYLGHHCTLIQVVWYQYDLINRLALAQSHDRTSAASLRTYAEVMLDYVNAVSKPLAFRAFS